MDYSVVTLLYGMKFKRLLEKILKPIEDEYNLNKVDLQIMFYLYSAGRRNTSKDIMELKMFTRGHISQSLGRLQKKGYVLIEQDAEDRRCTHNYLTANADIVIEKLRNIFGQIQDIVMQGVTEEEKAVLDTVVRKVNENINHVLSL